MPACSRHALLHPLCTAGHGLGPLLYITLELGRDQMIEVKAGYREVVAEALKRCGTCWLRALWSGEPRSVWRAGQRCKVGLCWQRRMLHPPSSGEAACWRIRALGMDLALPRRCLPARPTPPQDPGRPVGPAQPLLEVPAHPARPHRRASACVWCWDLGILVGAWVWACRCLLCWHLR